MIQPGDIGRLRETENNNEDVDLGRVLTLVTREISSAAHRCSEIQLCISDLAGKLNHAQVGREAETLQGIDLLEQTLHALASLLSTLSASGSGTTLRKSQIASAVKLDSLIERINAELDGMDLAKPDRSREQVDWL